MPPSSTATSGPPTALPPAPEQRRPLEAANRPLCEAGRLDLNSSPLPAFWVAVGTNDKADYRPATLFAAAMNRVPQVPFVKLNAGDTANAWSAALPSALTWLWQQLAPPDLRGPVPRALLHPRSHHDDSRPR